MAKRKKIVKVVWAIISVMMIFSMVAWSVSAIFVGY